MAETTTAPQTTGVVVDPEFAALIPPPTSKELGDLEAALVRDGCRDSLTVCEDSNVLLDGHNRLAICTRLNIPFTTRSIQVANRDEALLWIINNQLGRRNLSFIDRIALAAKREPLIQAMVAKNQGRRTDLPQNSAEGCDGNETRALAAEVAGVSHDTYTKGKWVIEHGTPALMQAVRSGAASINAASTIADLPAAEQDNVVALGAIKETAKALKEELLRRSGDNDYTPDPYLRAARKVFGEIELDPATSQLAQLHVRAKAFYTLVDDGLTQPWFGKVWLCPPDGNGTDSPFVEKLLAEYAAGRVTSAIALVRSEPEAPSFQRAARLARRICFPLGSFKLVRVHGKNTAVAPDRAWAFLFFGPNGDEFTTAFREFGIVVRTDADTVATTEGGSQ